MSDMYMQKIKIFVLHLDYPKQNTEPLKDREYIC